MVLAAIDPVFWLGCSLLLVAISLTVLLAALLPAVRELTRAARSAEKLFDTLRREFPPTLEAIRLTGLEISELTDDLTEGVNSASSAFEQVNRSLSGAREQVRNVQVGTRSALAGVRAAWRAFRREPRRRRSLEALPASTEPTHYHRGNQAAYTNEEDPLPPEQQTAALESASEPTTERDLPAETQRDRDSRNYSEARESHQE